MIITESNIDLDIIVFVISRAIEYDINMRKNPSIHIDKSIVKIYPQEGSNMDKIGILKKGLCKYCGYDMVW